MRRTALAPTAPGEGAACHSGRMRTLGMLMIIAGVPLLAAGLAIGGPFTALYLVAFIAEGGREAGRELALFLPVTLAACGVGFGLLRLGLRLHRVPQPGSGPDA